MQQNIQFYFALLLKSVNVLASFTLTRCNLFGERELKLILLIDSSDFVSNFPLKGAIIFQVTGVYCEPKMDVSKSLNLHLCLIFFMASTLFAKMPTLSEVAWKVPDHLKRRIDDVIQQKVATYTSTLFYDFDSEALKENVTSRSLAKGQILEAINSRIRRYITTNGKY